MPLPSPVIETSRPLLQADLDAPLGDVLGATARQTITELPIPSVSRILSLTSAITEGTQLDRESALSRVKDAGLEGRLTVAEYGISSAALDILIERKREEIQRQEVLSRAPSGFGAGAARLGTAFATSLLDPINVGLAFVPVVGEARYASYLAKAGGTLGRAGVRAGVGAVEGAVGAAIVEPFVYAAKTQEQADYDFSDSLLNVAFGTVFGGGLHVIAGGAGDALKSLRNRSKQPTAPEIIESMTTREREEPLRAAVSQAMQGKQVDIESVLPRMPQQERLIANQVVELLTKREEMLRSIAEGPDARAVQILGKDDTDARLPEIIAARDADAAFLVQSQAAQVRDEAMKLAMADQANAYAIQRGRSTGAEATVFERNMLRAAEAVERLRQGAAKRVELANSLIESMRGTVDRRNRVRAAEADLEQTSFARDSAETIDDLIEALPIDQQAGFRRRLEQGRADGEIRAKGSRLVTERQDAPQTDAITEARAAAERQASPESDVTADVRASAAADILLEQSGPAPKDTDAEIALQEQLLAEELAEVQEAARIAGVDIADDLADADELISQADTYAKAARAAALCGLGH